MSEPARNRFALDLDDLERQLRGAAQPQKPGSANDPLMELTRLVGQDDPLKELFAARGAPARPAAVAPVAQPRAPWPPARIEPAFQAEPAPPAPAAQPPAELRGALDEFEALLRRTEPARAEAAPVAQSEPAHDDAPAEPAPAQPYAIQVEGQHAYVPEPPRDLDEGAAQRYPAGYDRPLGDDYAEPPLAAEEDAQQFERPRSRKGVLTAAALIAVAVGGIGAAMVFRDTRPAGTSGQPPVIAADSGPTKVAPANPGGAEIPNQNKQIYERAGDAPAAASADKTKVVSREEQPVDVQQATRSLPPRTAPAAAPTDGTTTALAPTEPGLVPIPAVPGLGEPRRVRTVAIRPDGTPAPANGLNGSNGNGANAAQGLVTGSAPAARPAAAPAQPAATQIAVRPQPATPGATPAAEPAKTQERAAAPTTPPASQTPPARTRTAALALPPAATSPAPATTPPAPSATAPRADANGGFAVQLGAPGSEAEARATFSALQRKYPEQLGGQSPIVRRTELAGGKTVYRLRVGPYSRDDATSMCSALQSAGGQCFIAKN